MSTKDQLLYSALHGTAMRYAVERRSLDKSIEELRQTRMAAATSWPKPRALLLINRACSHFLVETEGRRLLVGHATVSMPWS